MQEENYEDLVDEAEDDYEQGQDMSDAQLDQYESTFPQAKQESNLYTWFWKVVGLDKPFRLAKVGNLNNQEIGEYGISMRDAMNLSHLGGIFNHKKFADYFETRSKIVAVTSMAKKGWFMDLSISQRKIRERSKKSSDITKEKWRIFNKKDQRSNVEE